MSKNYDNWERLVWSVLRREQDIELAMCNSSDNSTIRSISSSSINLSFRSTTSTRTTSGLFDNYYDDKNELLLVHNSQGRRPELPADHSDLTIHHTDWKSLLPHDTQEVVWRSASLKFFIDGTTGKNCFTLGSSKFVMPGDDDRLYWERKSHPKSSFSEVAELTFALGVDIRWRIKIEMLSPETLYAAYLLFELNEDKYENFASGTSIIRRVYDATLDSKEYMPQYRIVYFRGGDQRRTGQNNVAVCREDGWMEVEMGDFYVGTHEGGRIGRELEVQLFEVSNDSRMRGLVVEGVEFRPKIIRKGQDKAYKSFPAPGSLLSFPAPGSLPRKHNK